MLSLTKTKGWVAGTVALCLALSVAAWLLLIAPKRVEAAETREKTTATQVANKDLQLQIAELKAQFAELPQRQAELAAVKQAMPEDAQLPTLVRDLDARAAASGVTLMSLTPGVTVSLAAPAVGTEVAPPVDAATDTTTAAAGEVPASEVAPAATDILVAIPVQVTVVGNFFNAETFLKSVQTELSRDYLVQGLSIIAETDSEATDGKPAVKNGDVTMTITGSVFVLRTADTVVPDAAADTTTNN